MSIRTNENVKDRLRLSKFALQSVHRNEENQNRLSLKFRTQHPTKATDVDLTVFATGEREAGKSGRLRKGSFKGRPQLIQQLLPALQDHLCFLAKKSVEQHLNALRSWWRLFDELEADFPESVPISSVAQLNETHGLRALDEGMDRLPFGNFLLHVNSTRKALHLKPCLWQRPRGRVAKNRVLPPAWQTDFVRHELKHAWFAVVDRWELADALLKAKQPLSDPQFAKRPERQQQLLKGYLRLDQAIKTTGHPRPGLKQIRDSASEEVFYADGMSLMEILRGRYPDGHDIRVAFHLCLSTTGWNSAVFLSLEVERPFIEPHPRSPNRYVLRGQKDRGGGSEQVSEGLLKSQGSAGFVLLTLTQRTAPLRAELVRMRKAVEAKLDITTLSEAERSELRAKIEELDQGIRSPWLYISKSGDGIHWLTDGKFTMGTREKRGFLREFIEQINLRQPEDRQLVPMVAGDLRDAYAATIYHASGGSIFAVMKSLGHKRVGSTENYIDNTLLNEQHRKLFGIFSNAFWSELVSQGRVDPSVLAKISRDGPVSAEQRDRLQSYRILLRSRIGVGCKNPTSPPKRIAPNFVADGVNVCPVQRCLLCLEHAVLLPESFDGLCKRVCELENIRTGMSVMAWQHSSFAEELANTEVALSLFDPVKTAMHRDDWAEKIRNGSHKVIEFDGLVEDT